MPSDNNICLDYLWGTATTLKSIPADHCLWARLAHLEAGIEAAAICPHV